MSNFSTIEFTVFCLTIVALVAIVFGKADIAGKALSTVDKTITILGDSFKKLAILSGTLKE